MMMGLSWPSYSLSDISGRARSGEIYVENMGNVQSVAAGIEKGVFSMIDRYHMGSAKRRLPTRDANGKAVAVWSKQ